MLQSRYFSKLLFIAALLVCGYTGRAGVRPGGPSPEYVSPIRSTLQKVYTAQLEVREKTGRNDGAAVEGYLRYVNLPKGNPWCAAFVCWSLGQAGIRNPRSGWSPALFPDSKVVWQRTRTVGLKPPNRAAPRAGDVFGIYFPDKKRIAHCGFVDRWEDKWVITVEGNTNEAGSREGDGVYRKRRLVSSVYEVVNWVEDG